MTVFWLVALLFTFGALLMLLPPLLAPGARVVATDEANLALLRDQRREAERDLADGLIAPAQFAQAEAELQRRVLERRGRGRTRAGAPGARDGARAGAAAAGGVDRAVPAVRPAAGRAGAGDAARAPFARPSSWRRWPARCSSGCRASPAMPRPG